MRSATSEPRASASLARRVALGSALAAALGGAVAAIASGAVTARLVAVHDDATLLSEARDLADELDDELEDTRSDADLDVDEGYPGRGTPDGALAHELEDVDMPSARAVVRRGGRHVAGDAALPVLAPGTCARADEAGHPIRACAALHEGHVVVLAVDASREHRERGFILSAVIVGMLVGALLAFAISGGVARWALVPLDALRDRVRGIDARDPQGGALGPELPHVELEELRHALAELVDRLGGALASARGFAAEAAHELRTPLTKLAGELDMIVESPEPPDAQVLERIRRQVQGLIALVQRLLVLARPDRPDTVGEAVDLGDVALEVLDSLAPPQRERVLPTIDDDVLVRGDATLLRALVANVVDNALKFSSGAVELRIAREGERCLVDVIDDGPGIAPEERAKVFAPFYRTAGSRASGTLGHGVGLALVAHVAAAHGGRAELVDAPRGAHIRVALPVWTSAE